jgi:rod shape-determining protein MreC
VIDPSARRRRRLVLAALVLVSLVLLTAAFGTASGGTTGGAAGPLVDGASKIAKPVRDLVGWVGDTADATKENRDLRREVGQLRQERARLAAAATENDRLRRQLGLASRLRLQQVGTRVGAEVIAQSPTAWASTIRIDKGASAGVADGDPVLSADDDEAGLVGFVTSTQAGQAIVSLLPDNAVKVGAKLEGGRDYGILQGAGAGTASDLELLYVPGSTQVRNGTRVVTSGTVPGARELRSIAPPDLPIGRVTRVSGAGSDDQVVHLRPFVDLRSLQSVQVLTGAGDRSP